MSILYIAGCATNSSTANITPGVDLSSYRSFYVVKPADNKRNTNLAIVDYLVESGLDASTGQNDGAPASAQAIVHYQEGWAWDFTMFMQELSIQLADAKTGAPLANANSLHTSVTRKSPNEMISEVFGNVFNGAGVGYSSDHLAPLSVEDMIVDHFEANLEQLPISINVVGQGVYVASDGKFHEALVESVRRSGVFREIAHTADGEYTLIVSLLDFSSNFLETNMSVKASWLLVREEDNKTILQFELSSDYSKSVAVLATLRRHTNFAGAVRENVSTGLERISALDL